MIGCQSLYCPEPYNTLLLNNKEHELETLLRLAYIDQKASVAEANYGASTIIIIKETKTVFISTRPPIFFNGSEEDGKPYNRGTNQDRMLRPLKWRP